ncbi:hypothetical protein QFZ74_000712 [Streptomyces sp. V3I7]|nr:hypothetical protein [Streptomyces sp. V3I7]
MIALALLVPVMLLLLTFALDAFERLLFPPPPDQPPEDNPTSTEG